MAAVEVRDGLPGSEGEAVESGFEIDGRLYEVPTLASLDLDEEQIMYDVAGVTQMDFIRADPDAPQEEQDAMERLILLRIRDPRFKRALAHIAYRRKNPSADFRQVQMLVGKVNAVKADLALMGGEAEDPPPSSPKQHESRTSTSASSSSEDSGSPSGSDSAPVVEIPRATGTGR